MKPSPAMAPGGFALGGRTIQSKEDAFIVLTRATAVTEVSSANPSSANATQAVNGYAGMSLGGNGAMYAPSGDEC